MASRSERDGRLKGFRLAEVPIDLRLRAARHVARAAGAALSTDTKPTDRLFARLLDLREHGTDEIEAVAKKPSGQVYWVSQTAWDRVMRAD